MSLKLNIGGGINNPDGYIPVDRRLGAEAYPLAYDDNSADEIRASHILEHFPIAEVPKVVRDWVRALKPGGRIRVSVPDVDKLLNGQFINDPKRYHYLFGGQTDENDFHKCGFNLQSLRAVMEQAGLIDIQPFPAEGFDTASHPVSLNLEAWKPTLSAPEGVRIQAILGLPRVAWTESMMCFTDSLRAFGIPIMHSTGVFWGKCLQKAFNHFINDVDWLLILDYDSMFVPGHLQRLFNTFRHNPHIDALCPWQRQRGSLRPLFTMPTDQTELNVTGEPFQVESANFGLTLLRTESLKRVAKPWFKAQVDDNGEYSDKSLDEDIYFWHIWKQAGNTIYVDPQVNIGHLEVVVSGFDTNLNPCIEYVDEWRKRMGYRNLKE